MVRPQPVERESVFGLAELFFSTTDARGHITSGNDVFCRTSGYQLDALLGQPHNLIRHPDMPRIAFKLFWELLQAGQPVAAYVKNLAADGSYYWVLATALPVPAGYLSIRLKPSSDLFGHVPALYARLRAVELAIEGADGSRRTEAMAASAIVLQAWLVEHGFADYAAFMRQALPAEVAARHDQIGPAPVASAVEASVLGSVLGSCTDIQSWLGTLVERMSGYQQVGALLAGKSGYLLALAEQVRFAALNTLLMADRLGSQGRTLASVAGLLRDHSTVVWTMLHRLRENVDAAVGLLADLQFKISIATLQTEMTTLFTGELIGNGVTATRERPDLAVLGHCLSGGVRDLLDSLRLLDDRLANIRADTTELDGELQTLTMVNLNGQIESSRLADNASALTLFATIGHQVSAATNEVAGFGDARGLVASHDPAIDAQIRATLVTLAANVRQ